MFSNSGSIAKLSSFLSGQVASFLWHTHTRPKHSHDSLCAPRSQFPKLRKPGNEISWMCLNWRLSSSLEQTHWLLLIPAFILALFHSFFHPSIELVNFVRLYTLGIDTQYPPSSARERFTEEDSVIRSAPDFSFGHCCFLEAYKTVCLAAVKKDVFRD